MNYAKNWVYQKKTFYVYFPSKDDLVEAILLAHEAKMANDVQQLVDRKSVVQCITDWTKIARQTEKCTHQTPPMLYDLKKYYPNLHKQHLKRMRNVMKQFLVQFLQKRSGRKHLPQRNRHRSGCHAHGQYPPHVGRIHR